MRFWTIFSAARYLDGVLQEEFDHSFKSGGHQIMVPVEEVLELVDALVEIGSFDDMGGNAHLERKGSYGHFDEPGAVQTAREVLYKVGITDEIRENYRR